MRLYRLEDIGRSTAAEAFSGEGGLHVAGRWNSLGTRIVYTSASVALACLETLVHMEALDEAEERWLFTIEVPDRLTKELRLTRAGDRSAGDRWVAEQQSVVLLVPSAIVPMEMNALVNPRHPQFKLDWVKKPMRFRYDPRLK